MILPSKEFLDIFKAIPGALSVCESIAIMNIARQAPEGDAIELGTYKGKSAVSALYGFSENIGFRLVDPEFSDKEFELKTANNIALIAGSGKGKCWSHLIADISLNEIPKHDKLSYVFIDSGTHCDGLAIEEVKLLEDKIVSGGVIAFHDFKSQFADPLTAYNYLLSTGKYEEIEIDWQPIIEYVKENDLEKGNDTWHHTEMEFPCFVGALKRK